MATPSMIILVPFSSSARECSGREFPDSVRPSRRHRRAGLEHLQNAPVAVSEKYGAGRRLLGSNDAPFMPHRQPAVQSLQDFHSRPGIAGVFPPWQQLQGMQLEPHRAVPGHFSAVLEAQDLVQAQLRAQSKCFTASKLIAPNLRASLSAACTSCWEKVSSRLSTCTYSRLPLAFRPGLRQTPQRAELLGEVPSLQWSGLVQGARLPLQQRQVVDGS